MNIEEFRNYCLKKNEVTESFPFDNVTLVFKVLGKMFAIAPLDRTPSQANLKCDPERAIQLREDYDGVVIPGYHMNKNTWNTLYIEQLPDSLLFDLIDHSYDLIVASLPKYKQKIIRG